MAVFKGGGRQQMGFGIEAESMGLAEILAENKFLAEADDDAEVEVIFEGERGFDSDLLEQNFIVKGDHVFHRS